ncbi:unnamed protein product [Menidia menidia]|uniref:(Atlantic silverside) hypothetical protein n=1 Tax=Menidia menidia TaxID=238744 RepID=A0A8S4ACS3_9TELE|nr:unnamed protein product [Menidia menidia]
MLETETRHYANASAQQFLSVAEAWGVQPKITTVGNDSARNMIAAARKLPYEHMPYTDSDDDMVEPSKALNHYKAEPTISMEECPLQWWKTHAGAHQQLSVLARKYLAAPAKGADRIPTGEDMETN